MIRILLIASCVFTIGVCSSFAQVTEQPHSWIDATSIWKESDAITVRTKIPVCWENLTPNFNNETNLVRQAVADSWQAASRLEFTGWQQCAGTGNNGIRILVEDSGPHTKGLGSRLNGVKNGMVLNFTFDNWSTACKASPQMRIDCIKSITVHEFGHAIGFAHEQNRPDAPGECQQLRQGSDGDLLLTPYDPESVMNYCNPKYNNYGILSKYDKEGVSKVYGPRIDSTPEIINRNKSLRKKVM